MRFEHETKVTSPDRDGIVKRLGAASRGKARIRERHRRLPAPGVVRRQPVVATPAPTPRDLSASRRQNAALRFFTAAAVDAAAAAAANDRVFSFILRRQLRRRPDCFSSSTQPPPPSATPYPARSARQFPRVFHLLLFPPHHRITLALSLHDGVPATLSRPANMNQMGTDPVRRVT